MTVINTNVGALTARTYAVKANESMQKSMERLSSGLRINSAADDAAGLAVANKMESQLRGMNMAIRNSQDGISLVQTAEAGMGEITNMIIRMRELAVQMNNGVYTDSDRSNAQLEVTALLSEIDKIATNTAFNDVKVLDGSYNADIRAGNTNSEIIGISVKRMNTDSLGGNTIAADSQSIAESANIDTAAYRATKSVMNLTATESSNVIIKEADLSTEMVNFASGRTGTYSMAGTDAALFNVVTAADGTTTFETQEALNFVATDSNSYSFSVTFTDGTTGETFTDELTMAVVDNTAASTVKASRSTLAVSESQGIRFNAVDTTLDPADATNNSGDGNLSSSLQAFVISDTATDGTVRGTFSIEGADAAQFSVSAAGEVSAALDFDNQDSAAGTDAYSFNVVYTSAAGDRFVEAVTLNVTDSNEEVYSVNAPSIPSAVKTGDTFSISVNDGTGSTTITATVAGDSAAYGATDVAAALNQANQVLAAPVGVTFGVDSNGNITTTYDDALGDIADRRVVNLGESGTSMATNLAAASSGASFAITIGSGTTSTYTARLDADAAAGSYAIADLVSDLNAVDKSSFADANKVTFSVGDDGTSIDVKFDSQGANTTTVGRLQYDSDGAPAAAVAREVLFKGSDLASAIAATTSGDSFVLTVNDGTSATTYTYSMGASTATVGELVTNLQGATVAASGAARLVVFSVDNGQLKVSQATGGASANDFTVTLAFTDNDGTASETFRNPQVVTAGVASLGGATAAVDSSAAGSETVAGFSAQALQYNAIAYGTGTVSTSTTGADAINQVITIDNDATSGGSTLAAAVGAATAGETFSVTIGGNSGTGAIYNVTVGAAYSTAGDYTLDALASDLTSATRVATTARAAKFDLDSTDVASVVTKLGDASANDVITILVSDGTSSQSYTVTISAGSATVSNVTELASLIETEAVGSGANALHQVTFSANNGTVQATFDRLGASANTKTITMAFTDNNAANIAANGGDLIQAGQDAGALNVFNDATFSVVDGDLVATLAYDGAVPTASTDSAAVGRVNYVNSDSEEILVGSTAAITTAGVNAVNRVDTVATPNLGAEDFAAGDVISITVGANTLSHTLTAGEAADMTSASDGGKIAKIATHLSNAASDASASLTFSGVGNDLRVTFDTAGVNTDGVSQLNIDRAEVTKGTATKVSDGVNSLKAYDSTDNETGAVASNSADYGRNNTSTGNNTDEVATAQLGGSYAAGSGATTIAATSTITNIVEAAKVQIGLDVLGSDFAAFRAANPTGNYTVGGTDGEKFQVSKDGVITNRAPMDFETTPNFSFEVTYTATNGDTFTENVNLQLSNSNADSGDHLINVSVATQDFAGDLIAILDTALNQVSAAQAELGAIQNRLSHNIDNLTKGSMLTETSRGRIVDADFASETTQLSKQQILAQAATSMLAQANQSKQSVLALLQ